MADPTTLRGWAKAATAGAYTDAARQVLIGVVGDPGGTVTALTVEDQQVTSSYALTVFSDGDLHIGVQVFADASKDSRVGFVSQGTDGKWTLLAAISSLQQMGSIVDTVDPDTAS